MADRVASALQDLVGGDVQAFDRIENVAHESLADIAGSITPLVLTRFALRRVLGDLRDAVISTEQAQRWASFMRRGYIAGTCGPIKPIDITYEDDDALVDPISRLDELGDVIDGTMSVDELNDWIATLSL